MYLFLEIVSVCTICLSAACLLSLFRYPPWPPLHKTQPHTPAGSGLHSISSILRSLPRCPRTGLGTFLWASHQHPLSFHNAIFSSLSYNCLPPLDDKLLVVKVQALFPSTTNEALGNWALPTSSLRKLLTKPSSLSIESSHHFVQQSLCARQILTMVCAVTNSIPHQPYKGETTMIPIVQMRMLRLGDDRKFIQGPQLVRRRAKVCTRGVSFQTLHPPHDALLIYIRVVLPIAPTKLTS